MKEELIEFETAKLAKEKGFEGVCHYAYLKDGEKTQDHILYGAILAPTQSLLQKWLREEHKIFVIPFIECYTDEIDTGFDFLYKIRRPGYIDEKHGYYNTYEQALEAGLVEALKLI